MIKIFLFFLLVMSIGAFAQTNGTLAVLNFDNKALLKDATIQRVGDKLRNEFSVRGGPVVLDRWLIDTMMGSQGSKQLLKCADEQCLFAIGHLLNVDQVVGGSITKQNRRYCISAYLVDIKNNSASGSVQSFIMDFYDTTLAKASHELAGKLLDSQNAKKTNAAGEIAAMPSGQKQPVSVHAADSLQAKSSNAARDTGGKKTGFKKGYFWFPVAAAVIGGAVGVIYMETRHGPGAANDISLDDAPKHPASGFRAKAP